jgi:hypothetical protein
MKQLLVKALDALDRRIVAESRGEVKVILAADGADYGRIYLRDLWTLVRR